MKKLIILLAILAAIILAAVVSSNKKSTKLGSSKEMREKLLPELADTAVLNSIRKIHIKDGEKETTLVISGNTWTVAERSGFSGAFEKIRSFMLELADQKISKRQRLGKGAWGEVKLLAPGEGDAAKTGLMVELIDEKGKVVKSFVLGDSVNSSTVGKEKNPYGGGSDERFARVSDDGDASVWILNNAFSELKAGPEDWIDKNFIDVQKVQTVDITAAAPADSWKASRKDAAATDFTLEGAKADEVFDSGKASLASLLGGATFTDIVAKDKATADFMKGATTAKLTTFDGFTYTVQVIKKGTGSDEKAYLTLAVAGNFPKTRPAVKDEKEEDKKKADEAFAASTKSLEEKLAKEKQFEGWTFEVSTYSIDALLKKRSEVLKDKPAPEAPQPPTGVSGSPVGTPATPDGSTKMPLSFDAAPGKPAPTLPPTGERQEPKKPITVTTPPVSVPPMPTEAKPAATPKADDKPAAPAPAPAPAPKVEVKPNPPAEDKKP